ncbi:MAG TPA: hypothetical protein VF789_22545 [Thermoanaerobaculia bacterium]
MPRSGFRRWRAVLLLAALLPLASYAAHARETPRRAIDVRAAAANPLAPLWDALLALLGKEGSGLDPHGSPAPADAGGGLDPNGRPDSLEEGGGLDPSGRT